MNWAYLDLPGPNAFAHRGGNVVAPENTLAAFEHAVGLGYRYLETDVHVTRDGVLVAFHDQGLERISGRPGAIADHRWDELRTMDLGAGARIPRLDDLLSSFPEARFNIDPKANAAVAPLASAILAHGAVDRVCIGSFSDARIKEMRQRIGPKLCTSPGPRALTRLLAALTGPRIIRDRVVGQPFHRGLGAVQIPPAIGGVRLSHSMVEQLHEIGLQVHVWTINDEDEMRRLLDLGVDGVMTDETERLKSVMVERGQWPSQGPDETAAPRIEDQ